MSTHVSLTITGMTCGHCEMSVGKELKNIGGENVSVSASTGKAEADFETSDTLDLLGPANHTCRVEPYDGWLNQCAAAAVQRFAQSLRQRGHQCRSMQQTGGRIGQAGVGQLLGGVASGM